MDDDWTTRGYPRYRNSAVKSQKHTHQIIGYWTEIEQNVEKDMLGLLFQSYTVSITFEAFCV